MELEAAGRRIRTVRMDEQDRLSQASSAATISYFPVTKDTYTRVQTFGKRCQAARRDPNCPVVIRGWLNKKDSAGLKLWKRRWFVLSNFCLYYYKDSREESVLGSVPLPSYKILFCSPRECKNRKFTFKVVHQGMRSYFFSADTQEDMLGWVRALSRSATMEPDSTLSRRCCSYQDFTQMGGSNESVDFPKPPSGGEGAPHRHRHISRTLSEPSHIGDRGTGPSPSELRGRRVVRHRNSRTPSPSGSSRGRAHGPRQEQEPLPCHNPPLTPTEPMGTGSLLSRGQLASRPHTPVGRVDIRPHDDSLMGPQILLYATASPELEFKSTPNTPVTERWQNLSQPTYGSVHQVSAARRPLGKSFSSGPHTDLLPPLPPSSRSTHAHHLHHHHQYRSNVSVCVLPPVMPPKPNPRETPPIRPLECDADAVLTRLCGCDKLLQSLSVELAQLQMDKDSVHCALEVSRLQLEDWKNQGPRAQEEVLIQKALLQEELVTIRARMCDVSLEMERVWTQYQRMESELSVSHSQLQHICNFGFPQEQSQAQRELWMMEDILAGLKVNRDHFHFLLGLQRHHMFQSTAAHPGSGPDERLQTGLLMDGDQRPPSRPPLPQELQNHLSRNHHVGWTESPSEGVFGLAVDPAERRRIIQPDLLDVKPHRDACESTFDSKRLPPETTRQPTKNVKMSEEEQIERMRRNQERSTNNKKAPLSSPDPPTRTEDSEGTEEAPFPLRVTRVVTAVLPSSLMARRVSVEDPPAELHNPLPEQIQPESPQRSAARSKKLLNEPPRRLVPDSADPDRSCAETHQNHVAVMTSRGLRSNRKESRSDTRRDGSTETSRGPVPHRAGSENGSVDLSAEERLHPAPDMDPDLCLTPEQRDAKLRRVERIRQRVLKSAVRASATPHSQLSISGEEQEVHRTPTSTARKQMIRSDHESYHRYGTHGDILRGSEELRAASRTPQKDEGDVGRVKKSKCQVRLLSRTQQKEHSGRSGVAKTKTRRPDSPYHVSSMSVHHRDRGQGTTGCKDGQHQKPEEPPTDGHDGDFSCPDLREKWFLSTRQWRGFRPVQNSGTDSLFSEEISDTQNLHACSEDVADSSEILSAVSESLEKMNHTLFYKISCDLSISDTDIAKNDGNPDAPTSAGPEEEEELVITESVPEDATHDGGRADRPDVKDFRSGGKTSESNENLPSMDTKPKDSTVEILKEAARNTSARPSEEVSHHEVISQMEGEDAQRQEGQRDEGGAPAQDAGWDQSEEKESESSRVERDGTQEANQRREDHREGIQDHHHSSAVQEGGTVARSASFRKSRVTVIRTSL